MERHLIWPDPVPCRPENPVQGIRTCVAEKRRVFGLSSAAGGRGAQTGSPGTAWHETGAVLRARQDAVLVVDGGDCGQPDAGGWQSRDDGRSSNRLSVLQLLSYPYIHDLAGRHSYRPERIADTDNFSFAVTIALRSTGFSSELLGAGMEARSRLQ